VGGVGVEHIDDLEEKLGDISVAILTVPSSAAQGIADRLVNAGISGILNFTPARISVPSNVRVHHIDLAIELQALVYFLKHYPLNEEEAEEDQ
jgi:redox-sensing transcriptional repressor